MTKERKIAIEMWEYILDQIALDLLSTRDISLLHEIKRAWLRLHYPELEDKWWCDCWFCQYFQQEHESSPAEDDVKQSLSWKCPLNCNKDNYCWGNCILYQVVVRRNSSKEQRLEACDKIIAALKGKAGFGYSKGSFRGEWEEHE